jgi:hypothetical protein
MENLGQCILWLSARGSDDSTSNAEAIPAKQLFSSSFVFNDKLYPRGLVLRQ